MHYRYVAYLPNAGLRKGVVEAASQDEALAEVKRRGFKPLRVNVARRLPSREDLFPSLFQVKSGDLARLARELSVMLSSGVNLLRALEMLEGASHDRIMRRTLASIRKTLDDGGSLSFALAQHPRTFSRLFVSMVEVGESAGRLTTALDQISDVLVREHEAKQKAMRTMMYPLAVMALSVITLAVLMTVALPSLVKVFDQLGTETPMMTRVAVGLGNGAREQFLNILLGVVGLAVVVALLQRNARMRYRIDAFKLKLPLFGKFIVMGEVARASRTLAMLLEAGVPLAGGIQLVTHGTKNQVLRRAFADAEESLMSGHGLAEAMKRHRVLPWLFVELVAVGEETNSLQRTVSEAAASYQKQFEQKLDSLLGMMEPMTTLMIGGIVGFIAFSMFAPIYSGLKALR